MKSRFALSGIFYKYLLSNILLLLIPMLVLGIFVYNTFIGVLEKEIVRKNNDILLQVKNTVDSKMSELSTISMLISENPGIYSYKLSRDILDAMKIVQYMKTFNFTNSFSDEIMLYIHGESFLYSTAGTYRNDLFMNSIYRYSNWNYSDFLQDLNDLKAPVVRSAENVFQMGSNSARYITYIIPIPHNSPDKFGMVFFMINETKFSSMLRNIVNDYQGSVFIIDGNNNLLTSFYGKNSFQQSEVLDLINGSNIPYKTDIGGGEYLISHIKSENMGWTYFITIPSSTIASQLASVKASAFWGIMLVLLAGSMAIYYVMRMNYRPIKQLKKFTEVNCNMNISSMNELESVKFAVHSMSDAAKKLEQKVVTSKPAVKDTVFMELIKGCYSSIEDFKARGSDAGICFTKKFFASAVVLIHNLGPAPGKGIIRTLESYFSNSVECYGRESDNNNIFVLLLSADEDNMELLYEYLKGLKSYLNENHSLSVTIGLGRLYSGLRDIGKSYAEACMALDYRLVKGNNTIIPYPADARQQMDSGYYFGKELQTLELSLLQGNTVQIAEKVHQITSRFAVEGIPLYLVKCICFDIVNTVIRTVYRLNLEYGMDNIPLPDVVSLTMFDTVDGLVQAVNRIGLEISGHMEKLKNNLNKKQLDHILNFISDNYCKYDFSAQYLADHLQVSLPNLGKYFKYHTGENLSDHVESLRIEKVKGLLAATDENVQDIIFKAGYINVSSFTRKFRQVTGLTPGEYRKLCKQ